FDASFAERKSKSFLLASRPLNSAPTNVGASGGQNTGVAKAILSIKRTRRGFSPVITAAGSFRNGKRKQYPNSASANFAQWNAPSTGSIGSMPNSILCSTLTAVGTTGAANMGHGLAR